MKPRHLRRGGKHLPRPAPYQGWAPDEAEELAMAQSGHTPPMGFPAVVPALETIHYRPTPAPVPYQRRLTPAMTWVLAAFACMVSLMIGAVAILAVAFVMGAPEPAQADVSRETNSVEIVMENGEARLRNGTYKVEKTRP